MKTILIPTDFSNGTEQLVRTGIFFSKNMQARIKLLYSIEPLSTVAATPSYTLYEANNRQYKKEKREALEHYTRLFDRYKEAVQDESYFELVIERGEQVPNVIRSAKELKPELILLPDEHEGILEKILGESTNSIIQAVNLPVVIVPGDKSFTRADRVGFLVEYSERHYFALSRVAEFVSLIGARMSILHPVAEDDFRAQLLFEGFKNEAAALTRNLNVEHLAYDPGSMVEQIGAVIRDRQLDMLILVNEDAGTLQRWFTHTTAEKLLDKLNIPVLIYPSHA